MNAAAFFYIYSKIFSFLTGLLHALHLYRVGLRCVARRVARCVASMSQACETPFILHVSPNSVHS